MIEIDNINGITVNGAFHILVSCESEKYAYDKPSKYPLFFRSYALFLMQNIGR